MSFREFREFFLFFIFFIFLFALLLLPWIMFFVDGLDWVESGQAGVQAKLQGV